MGIKGTLKMVAKFFASYEDEDEVELDLGEDYKLGTDPDSADKGVILQVASLSGQVSIAPQLACNGPTEPLGQKCLAVDATSGPVKLHMFPVDLTGKKVDGVLAANAPRGDLQCDLITGTSPPPTAQGTFATLSMLIKDTSGADDKIPMLTYKKVGQVTKVYYHKWDPGIPADPWPEEDPSINWTSLPEVLHFQARFDFSASPQKVEYVYLVPSDCSELVSPDLSALGSTNLPGVLSYGPVELEVFQGGFVTDEVLLTAVEGKGGPAGGPITPDGGA